MSKKPSRKVLAKDLKAGDKVLIPVTKAKFNALIDASTSIPSMAKGILLLKLEALEGPWKGTKGDVIIKDSDTLDIEARPSVLRTFLEWLLKKVR